MGARTARRQTTARSATLAALALAAIQLAGATSAQAAVEPAEGKVTFMLNAKTPFEPYVTSSTPAQQQWMRETYWRVRAYPPFYDRALPWSPPAYFYKDLYAIYRDHESHLLSQHGDWVLRDSQGTPLYIPYGCGGGSCPQYAADVGNPAWRRHWIDAAKADLQKGYIGVHVDDVNLDLFVGNGQGAVVRPIDPRTDAPMTDQNWRRYVVEFLEQIRAELPDAWLSHNPVWWEDHADPYVQRQVNAADAIEIERGFSDPNFSSSTYQQLLAHIDWLHARGKSIILQPYNLTTPAKREFELASYFLVQRGEDAITADDASFPHNWWPGWGTELGTPQGARYSWNGLLRRDFAGGMVLVNQPGSPTRTVTLPPGSSWTDLQGTPMTSVTLGTSQGKVLFAEAAEPPPPPPPDPEPDPPPLDPEPQPEPTPAADPPSVTLKPKQHRVQRGRRMVLLGRAPTAARVEISQRHAGKWRTLGLEPGADGSYRLRVRARRPGVHLFRASAAGLEASKTVRVRVKG